MGGRSGGSGRTISTDRTRPDAGASTTKGGGQTAAPQGASTPAPRYERETEKAVLAKISVESNGETITRTAWIPKSQIKDGKPSDWIVQTKAREILEQRHPNSSRRYTERFDATVIDADNKEVTSTYYDRLMQRRR